MADREIRVPEISFNQGVIKRVIIIVACLVAFIIINPFVIIPAGHRGVVLRFSAVNRVMDEGLNVQIPIIEGVKKIEIRTVKFEDTIQAASKDIQIVESRIALNYHIDPKLVGDLYRDVGMGFEFKVMDPAIQEAIKATTAKFVAQDLIEKREQVATETMALVTEKLKAYNITVEAFNIMNFKFSAEFERAVEEKQVAQQNALKEKNNLEASKMKAQQEITLAQGTAQAIRLQTEAIMKQGGKDYVQLKAIEKWDGKLPTYMVGDKAGMFFNIGSK
jgi:regulator of protease activity HflC (stomatin/prohibitin superfamily)